MRKNDIITLGLLIVLTTITALFATVWHSVKYVAMIILVLSEIKFMLVAFQFMELKKAHVFWKILVVTYLIIFLILMLVMI